MFHLQKTFNWYDSWTKKTAIANNNVCELKWQNNYLFYKLQPSIPLFIWYYIIISMNKFCCSIYQGFFWDSNFFHCLLEYILMHNIFPLPFKCLINLYCYAFNLSNIFLRDWWVIALWREREKQTIYTHMWNFYKTHAAQFQVSSPLLYQISHSYIA